MKFGEPNENYSTLKFMHFEPSALYQSKWEEGDLGATSSETRSHADKSDKALWSASNQTDCKYFETITSSEFISSTQVCFKQPNVFMLRMFKAHSKNSNWNANILNPNITISDHANFDLATSMLNFVSATRICHSKLQLFCASCKGLAD